MLLVKHKSTHAKTFEKRYPDALILDITSKAESPWVKFSPFYPHGNIPVPFSKGEVGQSVEGIWQGLKVFETCGIDTQKMEITNMRGLKRTVRRYGTVLGHQKGLNSTELLGYLEARIQLYLPTYEWVLENYLADLVKEVRRLSIKKQVILLDYTTNGEVYNLKQPLSHAALVKQYVEKGKLAVS